MDSMGDVTIYRNGEVVGTGLVSLPYFASYVSAYVGRGESGQSFAGAMDEVAIYDTALSASRIQAHYDQRFYGTVDVELVQNNSVIQTIATGVPNTNACSSTRTTRSASAPSSSPRPSALPSRRSSSPTTATRTTSTTARSTTTCSPPPSATTSTAVRRPTSR
jgi:hypothetical protein